MTDDYAQSTQRARVRCDSTGGLLRRPSGRVRRSQPVRRLCVLGLCDDKFLFHV